MRIEYEFGGGKIRLGTALYVRRPVDEELEDRLRKKRNVVAITAPRQSGKTSLVHAVAQSLGAAGHRFGIVDFREVFGPPNDENRMAGRWFPLLYRGLARALHLQPRDVNDWLDGQDGANRVDQIIRFVEDFLRPKIREPLTLVFDEIDMVRLYWYHTDDLFEALRILGTRRDELDLSLVTVGIHHPSLLLKVLPASAFNLYLPIGLTDFRNDEPTAETWSQPLPLPNEKRIAIGRQVLHETGGQPYLTAVLFNDVLENEVETPEAVIDLRDRLVEDARSGDRPMAHFSAPRDLIIENERDAYRALDAYDRLLDQPIDTHEFDPGAVQLLRIAGLISETRGPLRIKSPIYRHYFDKAWVTRTKEEVARKGSERQRRGFTKHLSTEEKPTLCVLNTGGMIASERRPDGIFGEPVDLAAFFDDFPEMQEIAHIDPVPLMGKDSTNMAPADWVSIARAIYERRNRGYKGFVVAHGTDTLPYTASAVAFALGPGLNFPVVFTSAQAPRHEVHGDARPNLLRACTIATKDIPEVLVAVDDQVFRAVRTEKKDDYRFDSFHSPTFPPLALIGAQLEIHWDRVRRVDESRGLECKATFSEGLFKFPIFPGLNPTILFPVLNQRELKGIIIETPGIGNVPTEGRLSLLPFIEAAVRDRSLPVLLVSQYPIQTSIAKIYAMATEPIKRGVIPALNMSAPAAVTKFMWVLPQIEQRIGTGEISEHDRVTEIKAYMGRNLVGEVETQDHLRRLVKFDSTG